MSKINDFIKDADNLIGINFQGNLVGWTLRLKIEYMQAVLPPHYKITESKQAGNIHCKSEKGIDNEEYWNCFMRALKSKFKDFLEVYHNVCYNHRDFTIYFKKRVEGDTI